MAATASVFFPWIERAPIRSAAASRASWMSTTKTRVAPLTFAICIASSPCVPAPKTAAVSIGLRT